ncbi:energy-coupled thiamine transporter ThiT [Brevibacillus fulvus]|uniref:Thiamine transporter n=1 Tax=Brevibacillus fulvus TaxID=1125967 RepID=A0A939BNP5_9BACL|nr:energy-coupled thiamine transporter ThiT [Brevibacillus fulvus]MBM7589410.1 thiamine transporter [Brevibacillus fulvus]
MAGSNHRLLVMMEISMMAALAYVLSLVKVFEMPQGGSVTLVMVPIALIAFRRGILAGVVTGLIVGELNHLIGGYAVHPVQLLLDYPLAFACLGLAGMFGLHNRKNNAARISTIWSGLLVAAAGRLVCHFLSGVIWFGDYAPAGMPVALYSFVYNITYLLPEMIIAGVVMTLILANAPQLFFLTKQRKIV